MTRHPTDLNQTVSLVEREGHRHIWFRATVARVLIILAIASLMVWSGCSKRKSYVPKEYGPSFNDERQSRGIPIIPQDWNGYEDSWEPSIDIDKTTPHHATKWLCWDEKGLHSESDTYYSGRKYRNPDPDHGPDSYEWEFLIIRYDYDAEQRGENPWSTSLWSDDSLWPDRKYPHEPSLAEAEKILKSWGISRLNYENSTCKPTCPCRKLIRDEKTGNSD